LQGQNIQIFGVFVVQKVKGYTACALDHAKNSQYEILLTDLESLRDDLSNYPLQKIKSSLEIKCEKHGKAIIKVHKKVTRLNKQVEDVERQNRDLYMQNRDLLWQNRVLYSLILGLIIYILIKINI
jgi:hypothetical protein